MLESGLVHAVVLTMIAQSAVLEAMATATQAKTSEHRESGCSGLMVQRSVV
jgi:hypothetical protein